jgi:methyl-accepting chemotaxis protein
MSRSLRIIGGLNLKTQIGLIIAVLLLPLLVVSGLLISTEQKAVNFAELEVKGVRYGSILTEAVISATRQDAAGLGSAVGRLKGATSEFDAQFNSGPAVSAFIAAAAEGPSEKAIDLGAKAVSKVADGSNLTLDPDLDSYYVMDLMILRLPELAAATRSAAEAFASYDKGKPAPGAKEFDRLVEAGVRLTAALSAVQSSLGSAIEASTDGSLKASLGATGQRLIAEAERASGALSAVRADLVAGKQATAGAFGDKAVHAELATLDKLVGKELTRLLQARIAGFQTTLLFELALAAVATLLAIGLAFLIERSIRGPIADLVKVLRQFQVGDYNVEIGHTEKKNEIGAIANAMRRAQETGAQAALTVAALNQSPTMLMITDPDEKIAFMSASLIELLMRLEPAFRAARHDFSVEKMESQHIDYYRANPALRRELILDNGLTRTVKYEVGGETIIVDMAYITHADGTRIGHTLVWNNVTAELAGQAEVASVVEAAQAGDFSARLPLDNKKGFVREIASGLNNVSALVERAIGDCATVMDAVAHGDLTSTVTTEYRGLLGSLKESINGTVQRLAETVATIQSTATDVGSAAQEINSGSNDLAQRTEQQASALEQTAATTEELAASVKTSAQASRRGVEIAEDAMKVAETGGGIVRQAVDAMARIETASQRISDISSVIDEIAFQTNLLALNAAVEAARAGDAGKGFAVVASEVRTLAQRSSDAAKDITQLINSSTSEVSEGVKLVRSAGDVLGQMVEASRRVSSTMSEISSATGEQAAGIDEMSQAVAHMDEMTQQNAALAEESAASATALAEQIEGLNDLVSKFRTSNSSQGRRGYQPAAGATNEPARLQRLARAALGR